MYTLAI